MNQKQGLELKLTQKLILTPQLQLSIKLLQLPILELSQSITQELMENPFLEEIVERGAETDKDTEPANESTPDTIIDDTEAPLEKMFGFTSDDYFEERGSDGRDLGYFDAPSDENDQQPFFEQNVKKTNLYEHLLWQLRFISLSEPLRRSAEVIINNLNEDGYLEASMDEIAKIANTDAHTAEEALKVVQEFDPPGVGARNLQECLLLQLKSLNLKDTLVERILTDGFEDLEGKRYKHLAAKLKAPLDDVLNAINIIEGLEPRPGRNYSDEEVIHIVPDVYITESEGRFVISLNDDWIPRIRLSNYYRKLLTNKEDLSAEERQFLEEKMRSAIWLMKSLDQRNKTIYKVTESILKFQEDFFRYGPEYLKPLNLKAVAEDIGMHESTISRVTSNKYLQCPQGLFSFKYFFSNTISSGNGDISSTIVKNCIREIISEEDPKRPLRDSEIVERLKQRSINVARRTVAKYREELKIPPHNKRKKWA
ncbi:MAG: RNA polymerase factor sigma-54 [Thermodesulfovibrionia bacterium]